MKRAVEPDPRTTAIVDEALHRAGSVAPAPGLEGRILTRLAAQRLRMDSLPAARLRGSPLSRRLPMQVLGVLTGCLLAFVIVAGSVMHSRKTTHPLVAPPSLVLPSQGVGAASAVRPAAPASAPVPAGPAARGRSTRHAGRARIAPHARKAPGVTAAPPPHSSSPDSQN